MTGEDEAVARIERYFDARERAVESTLRALYGGFPDWVPEPTVDRAKRTIQKLLDDGFDTDNICQRVAEAERNGDELVIPGIVRDAVAFIQYIYELAHVRYAISRGKAEGLQVLAGDTAAHGAKFPPGRKPGSFRPIRRKIAKLLSRNPRATTAALWAAIAEHPPKGWHACINPHGTYFEGPQNANMGYRRFANVCSEERQSRRRKNHGLANP